MVETEAFYDKAYAIPDRIRACSMGRVCRIALVNVTETRFVTIPVEDDRC